MGERGRKVADLERQLEQLQAYRDEYVRNSTQSNGAMDAVKLQNYRSFLDRLGEALRQHLKIAGYSPARSTRSGARSGARSASKPSR